MNNQNSLQALLKVKYEQIVGLSIELAKKDDAIKEEVARREKELAAKDVAVRNELAAKDKQVDYDHRWAVDHNSS